MIDGLKEENMTNTTNLRTMKTKITALFTLLFLGLNMGFAQSQDDCTVKLSLMNEAAKAKNYDGAYKAFMELRKECPKFNKAIYTNGEKILKHKINKSSGADKTAFINDLIKMWGERGQYYASKTPKGKYDAKACQLKYDNKDVLSLSDDELYKCFDTAFKADRKNFKSPKSILTYFKLMVVLYDAGKQPATALFDKYDDMVEKVEEEVDFSSIKLNELAAKETAGTALTTKEGKYKKFYTATLNALDKISGSLDAELGERANCENLVPLYQKLYEENKNNGVWLQRAMNKLYSKGCKSDPMFVKIVKQKNTLEPNADTAYYLYVITGEQQYFDQTLSLQTDPIKKAKMYNKIANDYRKSGSYGKARTYYQKALELNPANKKPHLYIASMYSNSAKSCGDTAFNKRAVFWLAAQEANRGGYSKEAGRYRALAPSKSDIFSAGNAGKTIKIGCWIGRSVTVPNI
jgi:tetratricopeptide (TPR) repeat protein